MSADFCNTFIPGGSVPAIGEALIRANAADGFMPVHGRRLFAADVPALDRRFYLIWNARGCAVVSNLGLEEGAKWLRHSLSSCPFVLQVWARDGGWGYRLEERGTLRTAFCSKRKLEEPEGPRARSPGNVELLARACGHDGAVIGARLRRIERGWFLVREKPPGKFAEALECPVMNLSFGDVDIANAGITTDRPVLGWNLRLLAFQPPVTEGAMATVPPSVARPGSVPRLSEADRAVMARRTRWLMLLIAPLAAVAGLFLVGGVAVLMLVHGLCLRSLLRFRDRFLQALRDDEPTRRKLADGRVINLRHGCSVAFGSRTIARLAATPHRKGFIEEAVFEFVIGPLSLTCEAFRPGHAPVRAQAMVVEERTFEAGERTGTFRKLRLSREGDPQFEFQWFLVSGEAIYRFSGRTREEPKPEDLAEAESIVRSFRIEPE